MMYFFLKSLRFLFVFISLSLMLSGCSHGRDWRTASRESAGIAPDPAETTEAVLQVYAADAWGWRGLFVIHTWIAAKKTGAEVYTVYDAVDRAVRAYPWKTTYKAFPGPNSNTFTAWVAQQVPELNLDLPFSAIGSGYID